MIILIVILCFHKDPPQVSLLKKVQYIFAICIKVFTDLLTDI